MQNNLGYSTSTGSNDFINFLNNDDNSTSLITNFTKFYKKYKIYIWLIIILLIMYFYCCNHKNTSNKNSSNKNSSNNSSNKNSSNNNSEKSDNEKLYLKKKIKKLKKRLNKCHTMCEHDKNLNNEKMIQLIELIENTHHNNLMNLYTEIKNKHNDEHEKKIMLKIIMTKIKIINSEEKLKKIIQTPNKIIQTPNKITTSSIKSTSTTSSNCLIPEDYDPTHNRDHGSVNKIDDSQLFFLKDNKNHKPRKMQDVIFKTVPVISNNNNKYRTEVKLRENDIINSDQIPGWSNDKYPAWDA